MFYTLCFILIQIIFIFDSEFTLTLFLMIQYIAILLIFSISNDNNTKASCFHSTSICFMSSTIEIKI